MIIDIILDRMDDIEDGQNNWDYEKAKDLYESAMEFGFSDLTYALDHLEETAVKKELCRYIDLEGYEPSIKKFVNSVDWLMNDT